MTAAWVRTGRVWRFGDAVSIEAISPLRYMLSPQGRGRAFLAQLDAAFAAAEKDGDLIVAGRMFGHGPGHDHAVLAIKEAGIAGVVATSFAPQFFRHAIGHGLLVARCPAQLHESFAGPEHGSTSWRAAPSTAGQGTAGASTSRAGGSRHRGGRRPRAVPAEPTGLRPTTGRRLTR